MEGDSRWSNEAVVEAIVGAIAESRGVAPTELDLVLYEFVSVEAISSLASVGSRSWMLSFDTPEETVTVSSAGLVFVEEVERWITGSGE